MDIGERRKPQNGSLTLKLKEGNVHLRMSTLPTINEESLVIRVMPQYNIPSIDKLSLFPKTGATLLSFLKHSHGMLIFTGPTGSGKTTTLYSLGNPANEFVEEFIGKERLIQSRPDIERVEQMMNRTPVTVSADKTLSQAIQLMREKRVDSLLVVDRQNVLKGYVDVEMIDQNRKKASIVGDVYRSDIYTVQKGALLRDTVRKILKQGIKYVPVVDEQNHLAGIVTRASLVDIVYDSIWGDEENQLMTI